MNNKNKKEYILCAAIKRKIPRNCEPYRKGINDICNIEIGYRHHDIYQRFKDELNKSPYAQGFYTSKGRFVGRHEGMCIAYKANQINKERALKSDTYEKDLIQFINDNVIGNLVEEKEIELIDEKSKEDYYNKLGFLELFSEDLY